MALFGKKKETKEKKAPASPKTRKARQAKLADGIAHEIIRAPWFSEKALIVTEKGVYTFDVSTRATKSQIAGAIKEIYKVEPCKIRIVNLPAKRKAMRTKRGIGTRAARRKAYVYLNAGDTIQFA
ncbi:50S ribosomal protein L23 [Candidatus Kaiserbacteria bacterium CG_4_8_14_3_um_filter_50_23]|uniref:Large ribosomal subunit protein uL23 n=2 Tax=Candidatus Kaiseribacteriota TaxID=1752734 RepID=A0A2H0Z077_9BACT|nr:MAG: 50S ribosomal protein L23 [Candidatus Kaiserbacteria bacterium CG08_land_8_20_14_0_20_50_21]PIW96423.1 MAG: 50S ribosomal protein L23 [Candidatus Kaiserbacteria bacterium CG_4_8_14_3_um_filter_50_23]PJA00277.1 MAG: 50S ribosomal protein L23 [Candidatus Kaiserbacteria bacterium CG_4_10_14_0_2_um_filter_50_16]